ncbi:optic atrophy 3 protein-domain-containing protein [Rhizoctonia solani]|nr:optic atrophy 3 protein-domain-containing protein [Rhizoctonia solani]
MASVKLATLVIRTLAKPISARIKHQAEQHESFKNICITWAQWVHRTEVGLRTNLLGESAKHIKPLSETRAIQNGANGLAETFLFTVGASLILAEAWRSNRSQARRRDSVDDQLEDLKDEVRDLKSRIEAMSTGWEQKLEEESSRNNELSRILTRVVEIGLRGGWAEVVDQAPLKIPASVVKHADLPDPRTGNGGDGSTSEA